MSTRTLAAVGAVGALGAAGTYWVTMSGRSQLLGPFPFRSESSMDIALTFDDGPNEPFTTEIADFLDDEGITGTFFQVGRAVREHPEVTQRLASAGHVIGNHSDTHVFGNCLRASTLAREIADAEATFAELGLAPALYRPPWLLRVPALQPLLRDHGLTAVSGSFCHPLEVARIDPSRIARCAVRRSGPGAILIFHDGYNGQAADRAESVAAIKLTVQTLKARGHRFTTVDRLLGVPAYR